VAVHVGALLRAPDRIWTGLGQGGGVPEDGETLPERTEQTLLIQTSPCSWRAPAQEPDSDRKHCSVLSYSDSDSCSEATSGSECALKEGSSGLGQLKFPPPVLVFLERPLAARKTRRLQTSRPAAAGVPGACQQHPHSFLREGAQEAAVNTVETSGRGEGDGRRRRGAVGGGWTGQWGGGGTGGSGRRSGGAVGRRRGWRGEGTYWGAGWWGCCGRWGV